MYSPPQVELSSSGARCMTTVMCHVINHHKLQERCMNENKVLLEQNYDDSVLFNLRTGLLRTSCSHQHGIEE